MGQQQQPQPQPQQQETKQQTPDCEPLAVVLQAVRPDWTTKDLQAVQEKLLTIGIGISSDLFQMLEPGVGGLNRALKAAGQKTLKVETLQALRRYGKGEPIVAPEGA